MNAQKKVYLRSFVDNFVQQLHDKTTLSRKDVEMITILATATLLGSVLRVRSDNDIDDAIVSDILIAAIKRCYADEKKENYEN